MHGLVLLLLCPIINKIIVQDYVFVLQDTPGSLLKIFEPGKNLHEQIHMSEIISNLFVSKYISKSKGEGTPLLA